MLPRICESTDLIQDRLPKALEKVWDAEAVKRAVIKNPETADRPGVYREHVFDLHSGIRLIVSLESHEIRNDAFPPAGVTEQVQQPTRREIVLHISASWHEDAEPPETMQELQDRVKQTLESLRLFPELAEQGYITGRALHVLYPESAVRTILSRLHLKAPEFAVGA